MSDWLDVARYHDRVIPPRFLAGPQWDGSLAERVIDRVQLGDGDETFDELDRAVDAHVASRVNRRSSR